MTWSTEIILSNTLPAPGSVRINTAPRDSISPYTPLGKYQGMDFQPQFVKSTSSPKQKGFSP